jgi:hypothetical protein
MKMSKALPGFVWHKGELDYENKQMALSDRSCIDSLHL